MAVEDWIDAVADVFALVGPGGKKIKAFHVYDKAEFPDAINSFPCALTFTEGYKPNFSFGGPLIDFWTGVTELHLYDDTSRSHYPELMLMFARIRNAMAANMSLHNKVSHFLPRSDIAFPVRGPVKLQYGSEEPHLGIVVQWEVKQDVGGAVGLTVAA